MEKRNTFFDFVGQTFMIFGFSIISLMVCVLIFGEDAKGYSTIFLLGNEGLPLSVLAQFLLTSTMINLFRQLFLGGQIIKNMSIPIRTVCLFSSIVIMMVVFIFLFYLFNNKSNYTPKAEIELLKGFPQIDSVASTQVSYLSQ